MERVADAVEKEGTGVWYRRRWSASSPGPEVRGLRRDRVPQGDRHPRRLVRLGVRLRRGERAPADMGLPGRPVPRGIRPAPRLVPVEPAGQRGQPRARPVPRGAHRTASWWTARAEDVQVHRQHRHAGEAHPAVRRRGRAALGRRRRLPRRRPALGAASSGTSPRGTGRSATRSATRSSNLFDFDPAKDAVPEAELLPLDRWALARLDEVVAPRPPGVRRRTSSTSSTTRWSTSAGATCSAVYFDISKDRLYTWKPAGHARRSGADGAAPHPPRRDPAARAGDLVHRRGGLGVPSGKAHAVGVPRPGSRRPPAVGDPALMETFERLFSVRAAVQQQLEAARRDKLIGSSLEAKVVLHADAEGHAFLARHLPRAAHAAHRQPGRPRVPAG